MGKVANTIKNIGDIADIVTIGIDAVNVYNQVEGAWANLIIDSFGAVVGVALPEVSATITFLQLTVDTESKSFISNQRKDAAAHKDDNYRAYQRYQKFQRFVSDTKLIQGK